MPDQTESPHKFDPQDAETSVTTLCDRRKIICGFTPAQIAELRQHTALGSWSVAEEIEKGVGMLREEPEDAPTPWIGNEALEAVAGLRNYQALVDEWCGDAGLQAVRVFFDREG